MEKRTHNRVVIGLLFLGCLLVLLLVFRNINKPRERFLDNTNMGVRGDFMQPGGMRNKCYDCEDVGDDGYKSKCFDCVTPVDTYSLRHLQDTPATVPKMGYI